MNRREFCASAVAVSAGTVFPGLAQRPKQESGFPVNVLKNDYYIEETPIACYRWAPPSDLLSTEDSQPLRGIGGPAHAPSWLPD